MTIELPKDLENSIIAKIQSGLFPSIDAAMIEAARLLLERIDQNQSSISRLPSSQDTSELSSKPIWEQIQDLTEDVPDEVWDKIPIDLAEQHDHYIHGTPKRTKA